MMGAMVVPAASDVAGVHTLLAVIADPVRAKAALDAITAAQTKLAEDGKALEARKAEHAAETSRIATQAAEMEHRAGVLARAEREHQSRKADLVAVTASHANDKATAHAWLDKRAEALNAKNAEQIEQANELAQRLAALISREAILVEREAKLAHREAAAKELDAAVNARRARLSEALAAGA